MASSIGQVGQHVAHNQSNQKKARQLALGRAGSHVTQEQSVDFLNKEANAATEVHLSKAKPHSGSDEAGSALLKAAETGVTPVSFGAHRHNETDESAKIIVEHAKKTTQRASFVDDPPKSPPKKSPPRKKSIFSIGSSKVDPGETEEEFDFTDKFTQKKEEYVATRCLFLDPYVISPESRFHICWTILLIVSLIYVAIAIPVQLGFQTDAMGGWFYVDFVVDVYFIFDFFLNFFTGWMDVHREVLVMNFERTSLKYLESPWFFLDLVTSIPFGWVELFSGNSGASQLENAQLFKMFRALKAVKILRITRLVSGDAADAVEDILMTNSGLRFFVKMLKLFLAMSFVLHWMACMWHFIANPTGSSWIRKYFSIYDRWAIRDDDGDVVDDIADMAPEDFNIEMVPFGTRYLAAVYWSTTTMSTVGYGDITPDNNVEIMMASMALVIGGALYGILVGNMVSMVSDVDAHTQVYHERMDAILCYMQQRKFPEDLQKKIKRYYRRYFSAKSALDEKTVMADLSSKLKDDVAHYMLDELVFDNSLFRGMTPSQLSTLTNVLRPMFFDAEDYIVRYGDETEAMFIIASGHCDILSEDGRVLKSLGWGNSFGEECFLPVEKKKVEDQYYVYSVVTHEVCEVMVVSAMETRIAFSDRLGCNAMDRIEAKMDKLPTVGKHIQGMNLPRRAMSAKERLKGAIKVTAFGVKMQGRLTLNGKATDSAMTEEESEESKEKRALANTIKANRTRFLGSNKVDAHEMKSKENAELKSEMKTLQADVTLMKKQLVENNALLTQVLAALNKGGGGDGGNG
eukprot:CAMPEP_0182569732 /NCGR_PEP_ID=MMETSP1324-20130603/10272_1 /TAXON_ID=236786 /ORGANISM="Florenciella sp., Strain RCC1587" /LENGTH=800 /DNA_ID=CAMNT_0024784045 /DNA_START=313 /DNA_END=2712 /DNA_ORIENTATION=-